MTWAGYKNCGILAEKQIKAKKHMVFDILLLGVQLTKIVCLKAQ